MKVYFNNLNGIRFFSAAMVLVYHTFYFSLGYSHHISLITKSIGTFGPIAVNIFFILSSFLISYFLLYEKDKTGDISYKTFYIKRVLRIWPLYFAYGLVIVVLSPFISAKLGITAHSWSYIPINILFLLFFLVNVQLVVAPNPGICEIEWSVCIEEQFYLLWPILINKFRNKITPLVITMFVIANVMRVFFYYITPLFIHDNLPDHYIWNYLLIFDKLDLFASGLVLALIYRNRKEYASVLKKVFHPIAQYAMTTLMVLYLLFNWQFDSKVQLLFVHHLIHIFLFGYFILSSVMEGFIFNFEHKLLNTLGKISYGIYIFHTSIEQLLFLALKRYVQHPEAWWIYQVIFPAVSLVLACTIAYFSYNWFEVKFIRKKEKLDTNYGTDNKQELQLSVVAQEK